MRSPGVSGPTRLRGGATIQSAQAEMDVLTQRIAAEFPVSNANTGALVVPLAFAGDRTVRDALLTGDLSAALNAAGVGGAGAAELRPGLD